MPPWLTFIFQQGVTIWLQDIQEHLKIKGIENAKLAGLSENYRPTNCDEELKASDSLRYCEAYCICGITIDGLDDPVSFNGIDHASVNVVELLCVAPGSSVTRPRRLPVSTHTIER